MHVKIGEYFKLQHQKIERVGSKLLLTMLVSDLVSYLSIYYPQLKGRRRVQNAELAQVTGIAVREGTSVSGGTFTLRRSAGSVKLVRRAIIDDSCLDTPDRNINGSDLVVLEIDP